MKEIIQRMHHGLYYEQCAAAGLIITEGSQVAAEAIGYVTSFFYI